MLGKTLIMDNASIHHVKNVKSTLEYCGFKIFHLPPYRPFLNPIEEFWSKLKADVKRELLTKDDTLAPRITNSAHLFTSSECQGWIQHSMSFFPRYIM